MMRERGDLGAALTRDLLRATWPVSEPAQFRDGMSRETRARAIVNLWVEANNKAAGCAGAETTMCCTWADARIKKRKGGGGKRVKGQGWMVRRR